MSLSPLVRLFGQWGGYRLAQSLTARQPRMLMYHRFTSAGSDPRVVGVSAERFDEQVAYIVRHHKPITVTQMIRGCFEAEKLPRHAIAITVDDGYEDFYRIAWPILRRYNVPATFYVTTGFVDGSLWLWPDQLRWILDNAPDSAGSHSPFQDGHEAVSPPASAETKRQTFSHLIGYLLRIADEKKHAFLRNLAAHWGIRIPDKAPDWAGAVTWAQLAEMQAEGLEVGGHTVTHPSLSQVSLEQARDEIVGARDAIVANLGDRARSFCYPNGTPEDFVAEQIPIIREAEFTGAVVAFADAQGQSQRYAMRRHSSSDNMFQFYKAASGVEYLSHRLRKTQRNTVYE